MFCAPVAVLLFPELVPSPLLALGCPLAALAAAREFRAIDWNTAGFALAGRLAGAIAAAGLLQLLAGPTLAVLFALLILGGVALSLAGWRVLPSGRNAALAGLASGVMGTITSAGAPPLAIAMQHLEPARLRATLGCIFFAGSVFSLAALAWVGRMRAQHLVLAVLLVPWMVAGFAASGPLARRMSRRALRGFLLGLASMGALAVLAQAWLRA
jgi:uncharacterized membrane protein YfcA